jgi:hypothetical protein
MTPILGGAPPPDAPVAPVNVVSVLHCSTIKSPSIVSQSTPNMNWTRVAHFAFEYLKFPHCALTDPTSYGNQLQFHRYCQQVACRHKFADGLSEHQCLTYLIRGFLPGKSHTVVSLNYMLQPSVTVTGWLDELRERYFPGNMFRRTAESYWLCCNFREVTTLSNLIDVITRSYQMIFSDYGHMVGKVLPYEFSQHLCNNLRLLATAYHSDVA